MKKTASDGRVLRVIDANANRLTEGLRVCEDTVRFILDDKKAAQSFKLLRHRAFAAIKRLGADKKLLTAFRDSERDIGKNSIESETKRNTVSDVFKANIKRSEEAMRVLEEFSKLRSAALADNFKKMRFKLYSLEKKIIDDMEFQKSVPSAENRLSDFLGNCSLCVILDKDALKNRNMIEIAGKVLRGGADIVQYRNKTSCDRDFVKEASALRKITKKCGRIFIVNDRVGPACVLDADGAHIGQEDMPIQYARMILKNKIIGVSAHSLKDALRAEKDGADYIGIGPVFKTANKKCVRPIGLAVIRKIAAKVRIPVFAIGGINIKNILPTKMSGISKIAVISAAIKSRDICKAVFRLKREIER